MKILKYALWVLISALLLLGSPKVLHKPKSISSASAIKCLADNAWHEARSEGAKGMQAVIEVTINRAVSGKYPLDICKVVYQKSQFSWANALKRPLKASQIRRYDPEYSLALKIARKALMGDLEPILPKGTLWYHTTSVKPIWRIALKKVDTIGLHVFYSRH